MADMAGFGAMDMNDRGGTHEFVYEDDHATAAAPGLTPSQTIGPFFAYGLTPGPYGYPFRDIHGNDPAPPGVPGERISIEGRVFDAEGATIHDAMVEILQADASGRHASTQRNDGFTGYARFGAGAGGPAESGGDARFLFRTVRPGAAAPGHAPFIALILTMRGLLNHCVTRIYFPEDAPHADPVLDAVPKSRRHTLIAKAAGPGRYRFDIHMRGDGETVFFDV